MAHTDWPNSATTRMTIWQFAADNNVTATILAALLFAAFVTGLVYAERIVRALRGEP